MTTKTEYDKAKEIVKEYEDKISRPKPHSPDDIFIVPLLQYCELVLDETETSGPIKDVEADAFNFLFRFIYGPAFFDWWNKNNKS